MPSKNSRPGDAADVAPATGASGSTTPPRDGERPGTPSHSPRRKGGKPGPPPATATPAPGTGRTRPGRTQGRFRRLSETLGPDAADDPRAQRFTVGIITGTHGIAGETKVRLVTDDPEYLLTRTSLLVGDEPSPRKVLSTRMHAGQLLVMFAGVTTPEEAAALRGLPITLPGSEVRPLAEGEFFHYQLMGLDVFDETDQPIGKVTDLIETGANDVLVISPAEGPDILLPYLAEVVLSVDPVAGRMVVRPLDYVN
ncbi:MAG: ribosome maturation factor RimM [Chloroflexota bacterium]|nr:ribosome maturation factor RimM [Chloroflexota bacterium]